MSRELRAICFAHSLLLIADNGQFIITAHSQFNTHASRFKQKKLQRYYAPEFT